MQSRVQINTNSQTTEIPPQALRLKVVGRFVRFNDPCGFNLAGQVPGKRPDKLQRLLLQVEG